MGRGFFLKLKFMRLEALARPGSGFGPFFNGPSSMAETDFGLKAARAAWANLCFVDIPPEGTFFTGWNVVSLTVIEGWLDRRGIFIAVGLEEGFSVLAVGCNCGDPWLEKAMTGDGNPDCIIGDPPPECDWACFSIGSIRIRTVDRMFIKKLTYDASVFLMSSIAGSSLWPVGCSCMS